MICAKILTLQLQEHRALQLMPGLWNLEPAQRKATETVWGQKDGAGRNGERGAACFERARPVGALI